MFINSNCSQIRHYLKPFLSGIGVKPESHIFQDTQTDLNNIVGMMSTIYIL